MYLWRILIIVFGTKIVFIWSDRDTIDKNDITSNGQIISSTRHEKGETKKHTRYRELLTSR